MEPSKDFQKSKNNCVFCWGLGAEGQLGVESTENSSIPLKSKFVSKIADISAGGQFSAAVTEEGNLLMWGSNRKFRLSLENCELNYHIPTRIKNVGNITLVACGDWHSVILDNKGICYSVGYNKTGCLGLGDNEERPFFTKIPQKKTFIRIAAGRNISLFLTDEFELNSAGSGFMNGNKSDSINEVIPINDLKKVQVKDFSAGFSCCACVDASGNVYTWGEAEDYQLGHGNKNSSIVPKLIEKLSNIKQISCSRGDKHCHIGCVDTEGLAYSWGSGYKAKLGHGDSKDQIFPKVIDYFIREKIRVKQFISGGIHSACLGENNVLYTFGCGSDGRLGHPEKGTHKYLYKEKIPKVVEGLNGYKVEKAFCSYYHMIAMCSNI